LMPVASVSFVCAAISLPGSSVIDRRFCASMRLRTLAKLAAAEHKKAAMMYDKMQEGILKKTHADNNG